MPRLVPSIEGLAVAAAGAVVLAAVPLKADDVWWHLAAGEHMLATRSLLTTNHFSFTAPGHPWVSHEWLSEVLFALAARGPPWLLPAAATAVLLVTFGLLAVLGRRSGAHPLAVATSVTVASLLLLANASIRPYLLGNLLLVLTLLVVDGAVQHRAAALLGLFILWSNLHGSSPVGLMVLGLWAVVATVRRREVAARWRDVLAGSTGALCTPHGVDGVLLSLTYAGGARNPFLAEILEWQPPALDSPAGVVVVIAVALTVLAMAASPERPPAEHVVLLMVMSAAALTALRHVGLLAIAVALVLPRPLTRAAARSGALARTGARLAQLDRQAHPGVPVLALGLGLALAAPHMAPMWRASPAFFPRGLLAHLAGSEVRLFHSFNWGGALVHAGLPVFIDQRNDCYPPGVLEDYLTVHHLRPGWDGVLDRWAIDAVAVPAGSALDLALEDAGGWQATFRDHQAVLWTR